MSLFAIALAVLMSLTAYAKGPEEVTLTFLETSDIHGRLTNYAYDSGEVIDGGLVRCATIIKQQRKLDPDLVLLDCGDLTQDNLVSEFRHEPISPAIDALNYLKYDAWELGNHEFNFEFSTLQNHIKNFKGTVLGGNIYKSDGKRFVAPYLIKNVKGIKVAIIGMDSPHIPSYESNPSNYDNMTFTPLVQELGNILNELQAEKPDVTIVLCHYGEDGEKGHPGMYEVGLNFADRVDAFLIGHAHSALVKYCNGDRWENEANEYNNSCLLETGCFGKNVGKLTLRLGKNDQGDWKVKDRNLELLSCKGVEPDAELSAKLSNLHEICMAESNRIIGEVSKDFYADSLWLPHIPKEIFEEGPILDLIHQVLKEYTGADVTTACLYGENINVKAGPFRIKDACKIYPFDNSIYKLKVTGSQLKAIMERHCGRFFNKFAPGDVTLSFYDKMRMYEYDTFSGVSYKIDISKPIGKRIVDLTYKGKPVYVDQDLTLVVSNYRYGQLLQENLISPEDVVDSSDNWGDLSTVRSMLIDYVKKHKTISPQVGSAWRVTGFKFDDPQKELIYQMIKDGKIQIPVSVDGRTPNNKSINANALRAAKILPPLTDK